MAEEQENKQKPKATLIKHRKPTTTPKESEQKVEKQDKQEKKKVVVVKKKTKKAVPRVVAKKEEAPPVKEDKKQDTPAKAPQKEPISPAPEAKKERPSQERPSQERPDRAPRDSRTNRPSGGRTDTMTGKPLPDGGGGPGPQRERNDSRPPYDNRSQAGRPSAGRPQGNRPPGARPQTGPPGPRGAGGPRRPQTGGPPPRRGGAPQGGPGRGRPQGGDAVPDADLTAGKKQPGKKFFKSKKKPTFQKSKKEGVQEKSFEIKKKHTQRANPVPKEIEIMEVITVSELARKMNLKASELIGKLMSMGMMVTINQQIDAETAEILAGEYNCMVKIVSLYDETIIETEKDGERDLKNRAPIVTVMGHVDHGKTKLLDAIRSTNVVDDEFGGITQHIGAYKVSVHGNDIVFLDTPGHEAFTLMRARGAQVTDIVILIVAANDGVMPQTKEAIDHAKAAGVPIIVAVNKIDLPEANVDRVKQQLSDYDLIPEDWGGSTLFCEISALKGIGIDDLLESILLQAEILELQANFDCRAEGKVLESKVDHGRGIVSTVVIERGTLRIGDSFVAGVYPGKVRAMFNDKGDKIDEAPPATPVEILGFTGVPDSGSPFQVTESDRQARKVGAKRQELEKQGEAQNVKKITLDNIYDSIKEGTIQELKVVVKGDVHGSVEALRSALEKLSTGEIRLAVIHAAAGAIVENDVNLAAASNAIIVGFHVRPTPKALTLAEQEKVDIRKYNVIYDAVEDIKSAMEGMLAPDLHEESVGTVEGRDIFKVPKIGVIAGCYVTNGKVRRNALVRVFRESIEIHSGKINSLKRFKDDAKEVDAGYECGIGIENYNDLKVGDTLEVYEVKEVAKKLT